jgi:hypothetical protein
MVFVVTTAGLPSLT